MAYTADINIVVKGQAAVNKLQQDLIEINTKLDNIVKRRIGPSTALETFNAQLQKASQHLNKVAAGTSAETAAIKNYVIALGNANAARERQNKLIEREMQLQQKIIATANAGFGQQGPALPPVPEGSRRGPTSPIGGLPNIPGSPAAKKANRDVALNAILGGAFPALFGQGPGAIIGGAAGGGIGAKMGGLGGMALSIAFSAIGQQVDTMVAQMRELGNAAKLIDIPKLRESSLFVNQQLATTLERLKAAGKQDEARALIQQEIFKQTGMIPEFLNKTTDSANLLNNAWQKFSGALGAATATLGAALVPLVTAAVSVAAKLLQYFNLIASTIGNAVSSALDNVIKRSKFLQFIISRILNDTTAQTEEDSAAQFEAAKQQIQRQQEIRDAFLGRIQTQRDAAVLLKKLNGDMLTDGYRLLEIEADLTKNNEERYGVLKSIQDLRGAGGRAAGFGNQIDKAEQKLAELENKKLDLKLQANKESLALFEKDIKAAAERSTRALDLQAGAVRGAGEVAQSEFALQKSLNDLYSQRLDMEVEILNNNLEQTTSLAQQEAIFTRLEEIAGIRYEIAIANAKIERASAYAQIKANLQLLAIETRKQEVALKVAEAAMFEAKAKGLLNSDYVNAVNAQADALRLSQQNYDYAVRNAVTQERIADAMYDQKIEAAGFARNLELAGIASRRNALANADGGEVSYGQGLGQVLVLGRTYQGSSFTVPRMATGGFVQKPTMALIGEGGQGEYVVPESKASAFAMNYLFGSRGAGAIDGTATSPTINITTGPVMQQNGQNYVTIQDMEAGLQAVADTILNNSRSYSNRRFTGVS